jgi:glucokinase
MGLTRDDRVELAPNVPGWDRLVLPPALYESFPDLPLVIGNDVKVATLAELRWGALAGVDCGAYLNLGTGVAAGLVANGAVFEGAHGASGEIGYWLLTPADPADPRTDAAPTEEAYGGRGVSARLLHELGRPVDVDELTEMAEHDETARALLHELWNGIATTAANLATAWDPEVLALGGGYLRAATPLLDHVTSVVQRSVPFPPTVRRAHFEADASLFGAVALAFRELVDDPRRPSADSFATSSLSQRRMA